MVNKHDGYKRLIILSVRTQIKPWFTIVILSLDTDWTGRRWRKLSSMFFIQLISSEIRMCSSYLRIQWIESSNGDCSKLIRIWWQVLSFIYVYDWSNYVIKNY